MEKQAPVRLTFYGAARTVTGSKYLLEVEKAKVLFDCGLFQGKKELRLLNWEEPRFDPKALDAIVLTHAHIDHTGYLPLVVRSGYRGPIYCTEATRDLVELLLPDSANLQEEEARHANKYGTSKHHPAKPLYSQEDVARTLTLLRPFSRKTPTTVAPGVTVTGTCAGHILGAVALTVEAGGKRITFSGDIGRYDTPILPDPEPVAFGNLLLCESTYGDRLHAVEDAKAMLAAIVKRAADRRGPLIIPAFAVGRTQTILYYLGELEREGKIPELPVYVDSPMAIDATTIYRRHKHDFDSEARSAGKVLTTARLKFCRSVDESKALNELRSPAIIIAGSGMVNGGRVLHHMVHWLPKEETTVLFVGFQAEGTRGRLIQAGAREVKFFGRYITVAAHVESISGLSAHGDQQELLRWLKSGTGTPQIVRIVHGEKEATEVFSSVVKKELGWEAQPARYLETVEI